MCRFFATGCRKGNECKFFHPKGVQNAEPSRGALKAEAEGPNPLAFVVKETKNFDKNPWQPQGNKATEDSQFLIDSGANLVIVPSRDEACGEDGPQIDTAAGTIASKKVTVSTPLGTKEALES